MTQTPIASRDWWMDRVHPFFWPVLWVSLEVFCRRLERLMTVYGPEARFSMRVHWWGWIEIVEIFPADPTEPDWRVESKAIVARLLTGVEAAWLALASPCPAAPALPPACAPNIVPAIQDSS